MKYWKRLSAMVFMSVVVALCAAAAFPQANRGTSAPAKKANERAPEPDPTPPLDDGEVVADGGVITVDTNLVTIPVKVFDRNGRFVPGLKKEDFTVTEDRKDQELAYFSNEAMPFTVALVFDMSYSSVFKIDEIQQAALQFVTELRPGDKVMVVAFSRDVEILCEITGDRKVINKAIMRTRIGGGTSLYDAVDEIFNKRFAAIEGRKAIVLFTDGVDTTSERATDRDNLRDMLEADAVVYPIHYDTYDDVQRLKNGEVTVENPTRPKTTPPIGGGSIPGSNSPFPFPLPTGGVTIGGRQPSRSLPGDGTSIEEYRRASEYLAEMATRTGGRVYEANTRDSLSGAFSQIAAELREFYSLGYYPEDEQNNTKTRKIKVKVNRDKVAVRARDSYVLRPRATN